jgi:hypothetical protein
MVAQPHRRATDRERQPDILQLAHTTTVSAVGGENVSRGLIGGHGDDAGGLGLVGRVVPMFFWASHGPVMEVAVEYAPWLGFHPEDQEVIA